MTEYVAFDLETTGFKPGKDHIIQIGATRFDEDGNIIGRFGVGLDGVFVDPHAPIPPFVQQLCHISPADVAGGAEEPDAVKDLADFCRGAELIGHSGYFDRSFCVVSEPQAFNKSRTLYDTYEISKIMSESPRKSLIELSKFYGIPHLRPHRAPSDAEATGLLFFQLREIARTAPTDQFLAWQRAARPGTPTADFFDELVGPYRTPPIITPRRALRSRVSWYVSAVKPAKVATRIATIHRHGHAAAKSQEGMGLF